MKVLWITNTLFPDVCKELGISSPVVGGWMYAGAKSMLEENKKIKLSVATLYNGSDLKILNRGNITYFLLPNKELEKYWRLVKENFLPDIIHIHGTEYPHGLAYVKECGNDGVVVSIQGLVSIYERYYFGGIAEKILRKMITLRDRIRFDSIFTQQKNMRLRGLKEKLLIKSVNHIIGRTQWDRTHAWALNPKISYHFCNETLRESFYGQNWALTTCQKHSIFLSQAHYPIKGLQQMIIALPLILNHYPDTKVYVAGNNFITNKTWRLNGFAKYITTLIKENDLTDHIIFTGLLSEAEMCKRYLKSNVFVCPSSIENSPNSVGEAQLLGVPCVASYVGGTPDMITHGESGLLYRFEEVEMLAKSVCDIFSDDEFTSKLSVNGKKAAVLRHNGKHNAQRLNAIYQTVCKKL
ncbi:glycosyltransferase family 4 protein [Polaribacter sp. Q13]|uniref:glycosyltransferase family 4 protein n=1 Tax=Polaribacter sp. Q13 TaxID=2806551 RepID=UPI00193B5D37|nr:glycosyltransferase family 4 protein [Polaribacter sp. Q13]QVY66626.1 glycosyltransferase family 4 protein [Polaribacter sp. Q13]